MYNNDVTQQSMDWRIRMQNSQSTSNFKRSATMTGIVKGQRRDVQKTKTHVSDVTFKANDVIVKLMT